MDGIDASQAPRWQVSGQRGRHEQDRGDHHITDQHVADAIEELMAGGDETRG